MCKVNCTTGQVDIAGYGSAGTRSRPADPTRVPGWRLSNYLLFLRFGTRSRPADPTRVPGWRFSISGMYFEHVIGFDSVVMTSVIFDWFSIGLALLI